MENIHEDRESLEKLLHGLRWLGSRLGLATKQDLEQSHHTIMSAISTFSDAMNAFNDKQDAAIADIQSEIKTLNDTITTLQNSPGTITAEDQASLDALQARGQSIATKLQALDTINPPAPPSA